MSFKVDDWLCCGTIIRSANGKLLIGIGDRKWSRRAFMDNSHSFFFPDFFLESPSQWFTHPRVIEMTYDEILHELEKSGEVADAEVIAWQKPDFEMFSKTFDDIQSLMQKDKLIKAVPFVIEKADFQMHRQRIKKVLIATIKNSQRHNVHIYGFWNHSEGILGATPEVLFFQDAKNKNLIKTMACAGTKGTSHSSESFVSDPKELNEHRLVVSEIQNALSVLGDVNTDPLQVYACGALEHLLTPISVHLHLPVDFDTLVKALHPTPALGAIPVAEGNQWLRQLQQVVDRQRYGAPVGYCRRGNKEMTSYVAIRNMQWNKHNIAIAAGCGVIAQSKKEHEWEEIQIKIKATKEMLGL